MPVALPLLMILAAHGASPEVPPDVPAAPAGWRRAEAKGDVFVYTPGDLKAEETYAVALYPVEALGGREPKAWLAAFLGRDPLPGGRLEKPEIVATPIGPATMVMASGAMASGPTGKAGLVAVYLAVALEGKVRALRTVSSSPDLLGRYQEAGGPLSAALVSFVGVAKEGASERKAGPVGRAGGLDSVGGAIRAGVYEGKQTWGGEHHADLRVTLYANGEYRLEHPKAPKNDRDGTYRYDPATGALTISRLDYLAHDASDPRDETCLFGTRGGAPAIYANSDRGFSRAVVLLERKGAPTRPSPKEEEAKARAARVEAARYKFTTAPGKGIGVGGVEAVVHDSDFFYSPMGSSTTHRVTVLLKDGTAHRGFRAPLDAWDVAASRKGEPKTWGRWKRGKDGYLLSLDGGAFAPLKGSAARPLPKGTTLDGRWGAGSGGGGLGFSTYSFWGVTFGKDGRFQKDARGGAATTSTYTDATGVSVGTAYGSVPERNGGTYRIEPYLLVLRYDDGRVARMPFFALGKELLWFEDGILLKDEGK